MLATARRVATGVNSGLRAGFRTPERAVLALSLIVLAAMYFSNSDMGGDPHAPRGDGTYRPVLASGDGHMMFLMTRSFVLDRDLVFDNDLARFGDPWRQPRTATGRKNIPHPIGPTLVWAPFFAAAHGGSKVANALGADIASHGYTIVHQRVVFATSIMFAFAAVLIGYVLSRRLIGGRWPPLYAAVGALFGTSLTYYATYMPSYGHAMDAFFCAAFLGYWAATYGQERLRRFVILGALLGLASLVRSQEMMLGVVVAFEIAARVVTARPGAEAWPRWSARMVGRGLLALAVAMAVFTPQMIAWKLLYDEFIASPMGPGFMRFGHPEVLELLFSSRNGWLSTTPLAYAGVVGLFAVPRRARGIAAGLLLALAVQVWINSSVYDWWAGASFGQRRLCSMTLVVIVGLTALLRAAARLTARAPRWLRHALAVVGIGWFVTWNMLQVGRLRSGKAAGHPVAASCCGRVPGPLRRVAQPVYDAIGNPFSLPASAYFAWRYGVDIHRWDRVAGDYVYVPPWNRYRDGSYRRHRTKWNIPSRNAARYIIRGLGPAQKDERHRRGFRWTTARRAEMFVPLHPPDAHRITMRLAPNAGDDDPPVPVEISFNDRTYVTRALEPGWTRVSFDVPEEHVRVGPNVLAVEADIGPHRPGRKAPPPPAEPGDVGVAVGAMWVGFPPAQ